MSWFPFMSVDYFCTHMCVVCVCRSDLYHFRSCFAAPVARIVPSARASASAMACRKRPAAALSGLPCIDDVRLHVDLVREIMADFPEWGYRRVGARLGELLRVSLEPSDFQAVLRVQKADPTAADARCAVPEREEFTGDMREHVDAIKALVDVHRGMGYVRISNKFAQHFRVKLRPAHLMVVRRIMDGISKGRAVLGAQREPENHESVTLDVRDHSATIQELMMEDPSMDYQAVAHRLEERLQVELSDAQKQGIRGVMGRISIQARWPRTAAPLCSSSALAPLSIKTSLAPFHAFSCIFYVSCLAV